MRVAASVAQGRLCRATDAVAKAGAPFGRKLKGMWIIDPLTGQADVTNVYGAGPGNIHRRITSRTRVYKRYGNGEPLGISTAGPAKIARAGRGSHVANGSLSVDGDTRGVRYPSVDAPFLARENFRIAVARSRMLPSVRPLMRR
jgi:hypothetical protein